MSENNIENIEKKDQKIDHKSAEEEFNRFCESWEIDNDTENMSEEDRDSFNSQKAKLVNAIKRGRLMFDDDNEALHYTFARPKRVDCESVTIRRPMGDGLIEMDRYKDRENIHKTFSTIGTMIGKSTSFISKLDGIDVKPLMAAYSLFLG